MVELALAAGAAVIAIFLAFLKGQSSGATKERAKQDAERIKAQDELLSMRREADEAKQDAASLSDDEAKQEALRWAKR